MSHVTHISMYEWVTSQKGMRHVTHTNESGDMYKHVTMSHVTHVHEGVRRAFIVMDLKCTCKSCHTYNLVWMSHLTNRNVSHYECVWVMSHVYTHKIESRHTCVRVMSHVWNESCHTWDSALTHEYSLHTFEWAMSHMWISHVTQIYESCHTYRPGAALSQDCR